MHWPLIRYAKLRVAHAPGMPGTFSPPPRVSDPDTHHGTCVTHVLWCMPGSLTCGFLWSRWQGKRSRHSRRTRNPQFYISGRRPIGERDHWRTYTPQIRQNCTHIRRSNGEFWWKCPETWVVEARMAPKNCICHLVSEVLGYCYSFIPTTTVVQINCHWGLGNVWV